MFYAIIGIFSLFFPNFIVLTFYALFNDEAPFIVDLRVGTILMVILERRPHFIGYLSEEASFYWVNLEGGWRYFFIYVQTYAGG